MRWASADDDPYDTKILMKLEPTMERWDRLVDERNPLAHAEALGLPHDAKRLAEIRAELDILEAEAAEDNAAAIEPPAFTGTAAQFGEWIEDDQ